MILFGYIKLTKFLLLIYDCIIAQANMLSHYVKGTLWSHYLYIWLFHMTIRWRHNECDGISNHQAHNCLLKCLFRCRSKETLKLRVTGLCAGNSPVTGEFPTQRGSNAENVSIWWRHHGFSIVTRHIGSVDFFIKQTAQQTCGNLAGAILLLSAVSQLQPTPGALWGM